MGPNHTPNFQSLTSAGH